MKKILIIMLLGILTTAMLVSCAKNPVQTTAEPPKNTTAESTTDTSLVTTTPSITTTAPTTTTGGTDVTVPQKTYNILFIGNSYTYYNDMPTVLFKKIAESAGYKVRITAITCGGHYISEFADPKDAYGANVYSALDPSARTKYDYVILQDQSVSPAADDTRGAFYDGARILVDMIKATGAEPIFYATWSRKAGSSILTDYGWTTEDMTWRLAAAYTAIANELDAKVAYAGLGFAEFYSKMPSIDLHDPDKSHPSYEGSYLAALTLFSTIFNEDPTKITYIGNVKNKIAESIQSAVKTVLETTPEIPDKYKTTSEGVHTPPPEYSVDDSQAKNLTALPDSELISVLKGGEYPNGKSFSGVLGDKGQIASTAYSLTGFTEEQKKDIADIGYGVSIIGVEKINTSSGETTAIENLVNGHWGSSFMCNLTFDDNKYDINGNVTEDGTYRALITVNLGDVFTIDAFGWASGSLEGFPGAAEIYVSEDGVNWTIVKSACYDTVNGTALVACSDAKTLKDPWNGNSTSSVCLFDMGGISAKYIRIGVVIGRCDNSSKYNTINTREIMIFGKELSAEEE
jgi:hypothetical protein